MSAETWISKSDELKNWLDAKKPIVIYGAGTLGKESYFALNEIFDLNVQCFLDKDSQKIGTKIDGIEILAPESFQNKETIILVASIFTDEICPWLKQQGYNNTFVYLAAYLCQPTYRACLSQIEENLADETSVCTFSELMQFFHGLKVQPPRSEYSQYIHPSISYFKKAVIIDGGAYDGDSARLFQAHFGEGIHVYAFEPSQENFIALSEYAKEQQTVTPINSGLWSSSGTLSFQEGGEYAGKIIPKNEDKEISVEEVKVAAVDDMSLHLVIDYIKMDIEGAELSALKGAVHTISNSQPSLAICIYHKPEDWITLPKFIMENSINHDFYLGHHSHNLFETVFYAIRQS